MFRRVSLEKDNITSIERNLRIERKISVILVVFQSFNLAERIREMCSVMPFWHVDEKLDWQQDT